MYNAFSQLKTEGVFEGTNEEIAIFIKENFLGIEGSVATIKRSLESYNNNSSGPATNSNSPFFDSQRNTKMN